MALVSRVDRYLGRSVLRSTLLVLTIILALFAFVGLIDEFDEYGKGSFGLGALIGYTILGMPRRIYEAFPIVVLIGATMGLSSLSLGSELTAMRAAGISIARIVVAAMKTGLVFVIVGVALGELVVPWSDTAAKRLRSEALGIALHGGASGFWLRDASSFVNVGDVLPDLSLRRLNIYRFDERGRLLGQTFADRAYFVGTGWRLEQVVRTTIRDSRVGTDRISEDTWRSTITPEVVRVFAVEPTSLSAVQLGEYIEHLRRNHQETRRYELARWHKWLLPATAAVMILLAVPAVFTHSRSGGMGQRLFVGVLLGLAFSVLNRGFGHAAALYGFPPLAAAALPTGMFLGLALYLFRRVS